MLSPPIEQTMTAGAASAFAAVTGRRRHVTPMPSGMFSPAAGDPAAATRAGLRSTVTAAVGASQRQEDARIELRSTNDGGTDDCRSNDNELGGATRDHCADNDDHNARSKLYRTSMYFPVIVHRMLEQASRDDSGLVRWEADDQHFWIDQQSPALVILLEQHFKRTCKGCSFSSFAVQSISPLACCSRNFQTTATSRFDVSSMPTDLGRLVEGGTY